MEQATRAVLGLITAFLIVLYPIGIWLGLTHFGPRAVGVLVLAVVLPTALFRYRRASRSDLAAVLRVPLVIMAVMAAGIITDDRRFVLAMPVVINAALLVTFGGSLGGTPIVERFARLQEPDGLSAAQLRHCRQVTWAWCIFFILNGGAAAVLSFTGPLSVWAAYNGGIAYALMGCMFAGEYIVRQYRFRRYGRGIHDRVLARLFPPRDPS